VVSAVVSRLTYANVMATVAVFIALGGTSLAATGVIITTSSQIKTGAVNGTDVKNSSLTSTDIKDHSLTPADFSGSLAGSQGLRGAPGVSGATGPKGDTGAQC
jgi:Protein of unknown function (DUF2964)